MDEQGIPLDDFARKNMYFFRSSDEVLPQNSRISTTSSLIDLESI